MSFTHITNTPPHPLVYDDLPDPDPIPEKHGSSAEFLAAMIPTPTDVSSWPAFTPAPFVGNNLNGPWIFSSGSTGAFVPPQPGSSSMPNGQTEQQQLQHRIQQQLQHQRQVNQRGQSQCKTCQQKVGTTETWSDSQGTQIELRVVQSNACKHGKNPVDVEKEAYLANAATKA